MKYMGSKNRHAREILAVIPRQKDQIWVEPFVGGANMIDKVDNILRIGADINSYLISMWKALLNGWIPPENISEAEYYRIRDLDEYKQWEPVLYAFVGIGCSYAGKWWGGYARGAERNYCRESRDNVLKQIPKLKKVHFVCADYRHLNIPSKSLIYCDPPYMNATAYRPKFDSRLFWEWCDRKVNEGHSVYVSEYTAPSDWICIWSKVVNNTLVKETGSKQGVERLFTKG